ncbi:hypothetical protein PP7435_CHR1-2137 [Komagataella phaffii CBS 7435]|uniref:Cyclin n=2 Tax=Komagataella phaffii TaxID=460519 RepID=C4QWC0_KOMPG|nr:Hypothetical protein PAS_chr1-1_0178 [Komagataella phaffii GS115]AOA60941.1 GQ67_02757T0 [Komagataella phaffii]CAH2446213.1 hypothetical protein BQ9382_C1-2530 [Komagataella phaffii CBS 7435]AOA65990.1 GQ68_02491T0 [Komagataella phaffii GS115]CAY67543.1 Hypothetical protein PAS_chr1-1_0178 [Komagataella phaffii GS115]SCV11810.1 hypothetical protein PP7435_CHR1-2137 [Komagataella phaffii CBS 7435]
MIDISSKLRRDSLSDTDLNQDPNQKKINSEPTKLLLSEIALDPIIQSLPHVKDLNVIQPAEALALLNKLATELLSLYAEYEQHGSMDLAPLLYDSSKYAKPGSDSQEESPTPVSGFLERKLSMIDHSDIDKMSDSSQADQFKIRTISSDSFDIPLKSESKLGYNFDDLEEGSSTNESSLSTLNNTYVDNSVEQTFQNEVSFETCTNIVKIFNLKAIPSLSITAYLERIHSLLSPSTAVYLTACLYLYNCAFHFKTVRLKQRSHFRPSQHTNITMLPINELNIFRLVSAIIRIASKLIEDKNFKQTYYCKVAGLQSMKELQNLELSFLFLFNFNLFVSREILLSHLDQLYVFFNRRTQLNVSV